MRSIRPISKLVFSNFIGPTELVRRSSPTSFDNVEGIDVLSINQDHEIDGLDSHFLAVLESDEIYDMDRTIGIEYHIQQLSELAKAYDVSRKGEGDDG